MKTKHQKFIVTFAHVWVDNYVSKNDVETALRDYFERYLLAKQLKIKVKKEGGKNGKG